MEVVLVAIMGENRVIGDGTTQPWHFRCDLRRFQALTRDHPVAMGRKTFAAVGRPLPQRTNIVLSRDPHFAAPGVEVVASRAEALERAAAAPGGERLSVIGGGALYRLFLPLAQRIELTVVADRPAGAVRFPELDAEWRERQRSAASESGYALAFVTLERHG